MNEMSFAQNYIGLDAKIEAVVRRILGDFDMDLSDYPTIEEMNQAIADAIAGGGGGGGTNNYMLLINKPLDSVENELYYGWQMFRTVDGKQFALYVGSNGESCAVMTYDSMNKRFGIGVKSHTDMIVCNDDGTVTFSGNVDAPNMITEDRVREIINEMLPETYTKDEIDSKLAVKADSANVYTKEQTYDRDTIDEKIAGGGGGGGTTDYNQLSNRPIVDGVVQSGLDMNGNSITKLYTIDAANNNFTVSNPLAFKVGEWLTVHNDQDITVNITTEKGLHINAPSILLNGEIENVYTKSASDARVRELFAELMNRAVQIQTLNTKNILLYPKGSEGWSGDVTGGIYVTGSTVDDMRMLIGAGDAYISVTRDTTTFDTPNAVFGIRPYNINVSRDTESDKIIVQSEQKP